MSEDEKELPAHGWQRYALSPKTGVPCRCETCRLSMSEHRAELRVKAREIFNEFPDLYKGQHGQEYTYRWFGCRCYACCLEANNRHNERTKKRKEKGNDKP